MTPATVNFCSVTDELASLFSIRFGAWRQRSAAAARASAWLILLSGFIPTASAQGQDRPLKLLLDTSLVWDANLFRAPESNTDPQLASRGLSGRSDRIATTHFGLRFDKSYAQQRITFDAGQSATRYDKFAFLDSNAFNYKGAWQWHLTPRISGTLSADRSESLVGFDDTRVLTRNVSITTNRGLTLDAWLFGGWHLLGGLSQTVQKSEALFAPRPDFTQRTWEYGFKYITGSQNSISLVERRSRGVNTGQAVDFVNLIDSGFTVRDYVLAGNWRLSGKSTLSGQLTHTARRNNNIPQRDFSGVSSNLQYGWSPTGKLSLAVSAGRSIAPFTSGTASSSRVEDSLTFSPTWTPTSRTSLQLNASQRVSSFPGAGGLAAGPARRDTLRSLQLTASWTPHTRVTLSATVQRDRRQSSDGALSYEDAIARVTASLAF